MLVSLWACRKSPHPLICQAAIFKVHHVMNTGHRGYTLFGLSGGTLSWYPHGFKHGPDQVACTIFSQGHHSMASSHLERSLHDIFDLWVHWKRGQVCNLKAPPSLLLPASTYFGLYDPSNKHLNVIRRPGFNLETNTAASCVVALNAIFLDGPANIAHCFFFSFP